MDQKNQMVFFPNLDGLRFCAFFFVIISHIGYTENPDILNNVYYNFIRIQIFATGGFGVNFFFVLSGFLITYLLLNEKIIFSKINIKAFYSRRILRIWPVYYLILIIGFIIVPYAKHFIGVQFTNAANPWYYIFFIGNFNPYNINSVSNPLIDRLWSISVEEQFYFIWPLIIAFVPSKKLPLIFSILIAISVVFRYIHNNENGIIYFHTLIQMSDLVIGSWSAYLVFFNNRFKSYFIDLRQWQIFLIYILAAIIFLGYQIIYKNVSNVLVLQTLFGVVFALIILEQNYSINSFYKMSKFKTISKWGTWTYGLYCYHAIGIFAAIEISKMIHLNSTIFEVLITNTIIAISVSLIISWFSYKYFETPFLRLKNKLQKVKAHQ